MCDEDETQSKANVKSEVVNKESSGDGGIEDDPRFFKHTGPEKGVKYPRQIIYCDGTIQITLIF